jgi:hypothetical protein
MYGNSKHPVCQAYVALGAQNSMIPQIYFDANDDPGIINPLTITSSTASFTYGMGNLNVSVLIFKANGTVSEPISFENWILRLCRTGLDAYSFASSMLQLGITSESAQCLMDYATVSGETYELFMYDQSNTGLIRIPAVVPVSGSGTRTLRRFFAYDGAALGESGARYLSTLSWSMELTTAGMKVPYLNLQYTEILGTSYMKALGDSWPQLSLNASYYMKTESFWVSIRYTVVALSFISVFVWLLRISSYSRRNRQNTDLLSDFHTITRTLNLLAGFLGISFFIVLFFIAAIVSIFIAFQRRAVILWPLPSDDYVSFYIGIVSTFLVQLFHVVATVYLQVSAKTYIVDWERPNKDIGSGQQQPSGWRSIHIARKLVEISTFRRINISLSCIFLLIIPTSTDALQAFSIDSLAFIGVCLGQVR